MSRYKYIQCTTINNITDWWSTEEKKSRHPWQSKSMSPTIIYYSCKYIQVQERVSYFNVQPQNAFCMHIRGCYILNICALWKMVPMHSACIEGCSIRNPYTLCILWNYGKAYTVQQNWFTKYWNHTQNLHVIIYS